jgi:hypothetical protein
MKFNNRLTHEFLEIFKKSYIITKYVCYFETKNNTNHKPLFVVCDFETRPIICKNYCPLNDTNNNMGQMTNKGNFLTRVKIKTVIKQTTMTTMWLSNENRA